MLNKWDTKYNMSEKIAIYPGTFDPITNGHADVIERAAKLFDKVVVLIALNSKKKNLFTVEERVEMARYSVKHISNAVVDFHQGLTVDYARQKEAIALIRGVRAISDFEYEFQIALMNRKLDEDVTTVFLMPHEKYTYLNSSIIRELAGLYQDVSEFVSPFVVAKLKEKFD
jgi:pantetheine-phosphate adenylyltransferase